ncbi:hypothetical protein D3C78_1293990 [compost metagenome]
MGPVILQRQRPGDAGTGEQQALLRLQIRQFFHQAQGQWMSGRLALQRIKHRRHISRSQRAEADTALRAVHFQQRFQPVQATRTGALQLQWQIAFLSQRDQGHSDLIGTHGTGKRITGQIERWHHASSRQASSNASRRSALSRACTWPSSSSAGEQAQAPRQYTGRKLMLPSALLP